MIRVHVFISGRVQGVLFRDSARRRAKRINVYGWIKNLPDKRVEMVLEGEEDKVNELLDWAKIGPFFARVDHIDIKKEKYIKEFNNFKIIY